MYADYLERVANHGKQIYANYERYLDFLKYENPHGNFDTNKINIEYYATMSIEATKYILPTTYGNVFRFSYCTEQQLEKFIENTQIIPVISLVKILQARNMTKLIVLFVHKYPQIVTDENRNIYPQLSDIYDHRQFIMA